MYVELNHIQKRYGNYQASDDVSFGIEKGKLIGLLGPSGSGKTTILRMIAGLEHPDSGEIRIDGKVVNDIPASKRGIGFVFQNYALFRYMTVYDNIAFGLKIQKVDRKTIANRVMELVDLIGLRGLERRYPSQLSGGQRQRVAFARALAPNPQLLLLDEPFAAIDAKVRQELRSWLKEMISKLGVTSIFVTHDQDEAIEVADEIIITNRGHIEQMGTPIEIYRHPQTAFVRCAAHLVEGHMQRRDIDIRDVHRHLSNAILLDKPANGLGTLQCAGLHERITLGIAHDFARNGIALALRTSFFAHVECNGVSASRRSRVQVEIHGNQEVARPHSRTSGSRHTFVKRTSPKVRLTFVASHFFRQRLVFASPAYGQVSPFGFESRSLVAVARNVSLAGNAFCQFSCQFGTFLQRDTAHRHQGQHVGSPHARMRPVVLAHVDEFARATHSPEGSFAHGLRFAHKGNDRTVGSFAGVDVE